MNENNSLTDQIRKILDDKKPRRLPDSETHFLHAAVLIPIYRNDDGYHILFTERTRRVPHHKGEISFPGGSVDPADGSYQETALREAREEIGLLPDDVDVLGPLDDETTVASQFIIHPFVGLIPHPYRFKINRAEVEKLLPVPFKHFFSDDPSCKCSSIDFDDFTYEGPVFLHQGDIIWGATARIMDRFICEILEKIPSLIHGE